MSDAAATVFPMLARCSDDSVEAPLSFTKQQDIHVEVLESENESSSWSASSKSRTDTHNATAGGPVPLAICGIATRLPGGISNTTQLWEFLINKGDACARIPADRYATHVTQGNTSQGAKNLPGDAAVCAGDDPGPGGKPEGDTLSDDRPNWQTHGYMLNHLDLAAFDASMFSMKRSELGNIDPQQRLLLELTRECFEDAGETGWNGKNVGVYVGSFGDDWHDFQFQDPQEKHVYKLTGTSDFVLANRISYEYDLKGPSMTIKTGCSASLVGFHLACQELQKGDLSSVLVGGCNLNLSPQATQVIYDSGVLSNYASSRSFDASASGYARGEAAHMVLVKRLDDAIRDGNPIRAVVRSTASSCDGRTAGITMPSTEAHEALIRACYRQCELDHEIGKTAFFECHATGTAGGDPVETTAVANVFGDQGGVYIGSIKPNVGHAEGASGHSSLIKCVLALEHRVIPPNIKFHEPNPNIPWEQGRLVVPTEPTPWPADRLERVSVNSFGVGGANAHVILDSAASFGLDTSRSGGESSVGIAKGASSSRLVVFTANHIKSAARGADDYSDYLATQPHTLDDVAYTLGLRREHLPCRTFAVANHADLQTGGVVRFSSPVKTPSVVPNVVFVFTGQGAQWPTMGLKLMSGFASARNDIASMDATLAGLGQDLAPDWTIAEELRRPRDSTRVYTAQFSQPLCTAVQLMLINQLRSWGVQPSSVIGHSSGEIAAAYACGALTMDEAIICAYLRGRIMVQPTKHAGAMAAVGLGVSALEPYLRSGVVMACENSPSSTTISGDADQVDLVLESLAQERPETFTRRLQVDRAYHSDHMKELGQQYEQSVSRHVSSKAPTIPFISTVTGQAIDTKNGMLDAPYWRMNLESPVLFNTGMNTLLQSQGSNTNTVLLEIGPHAALAGPLRQILKDVGRDGVPYLSTVMRGEDECKTLLTAAGQLFCQGIDIRFDAVNPIMGGGRVLSNLPTYPWNRDTRYWHESRLSREARTPSFPHHPLLGSRVAAVGNMEPTWRNLLQPDNSKIPWCGDHKVGGDVVLPATAYLAMAAEAIRQISVLDGGHQGHDADEVSLRQVTVPSALVLDNVSPVEMVLSLRPHRLTNSLDSAWYEFNISSYSETSASWTKRCFGQVRAGTNGDEVHIQPREPIRSLARKMSTRAWYKSLRDLGMGYGPQFQTLSRLSADPVHYRAVADVKVDTVAVKEIGETESEMYRYYHPASTDAGMQLFFAAQAHGQARSLRSKTLPNYVGSAYLRRISTDPVTSANTSPLLAEATLEALPSGTMIGTCTAVDDAGCTAFQLRDVRFVPLDDGDGLLDRDHNDPYAGGRVAWRPDVDFLPVTSLIRGRMNKIRDLYHLLQRLLLLCCIDARARFGDLCTPGDAPHLGKFQAWVNDQAAQAESSGEYPLVDTTLVHELLGLTEEARGARIADYIAMVEATEYAAIGSLVGRVFGALGELYRGTVTGVEVLRRRSGDGDGDDSDLLHRVYDLANATAWDYGGFLRLLRHRTPALRVLEVGAGTGGTTEVVLAGLRETNAVLSYTYTDVSAAFFSDAKERFKSHAQQMVFKTLDITEDPVSQGFDLGSYDLVVAANVVHATPQLRITLANLRKLLRPNGRLLLQELSMQVKWINFIMGVLPAWWLGEADGRIVEPYPTTSRWVDELKDAGFSTSSAECAMYDDEPPYQANLTIVASPAITRVEDLETHVYLLSNNPDGPLANALSSSLKQLGCSVQMTTLSDEPRGSVISLLDLEGPSVFDHQQLTAHRWVELQKYLSNLTSAGILWLTRPCQLGGSTGTDIDPQYAAIIGVFRVMRNETGLPLATLEMDESDSPRAMQAVVDVYRKIRETLAFEKPDEMADPDYEFALSDGLVHLPRFDWVKVADELSSARATSKNEAHDKPLKRLEIGKSGSLQTLKWVEKARHQSLEGEDILIDVKAVGMNFKDTLIAMGIVNGPKRAGHGLGSECTGVVSAIGPDVTDFKIGDRVMAITADAYATTTKTAAYMAHKLPDGVSFEDGATMICVYFTAIHGLINLARLEKGQTVLIHSACGGVGLAAIRICRAVGASKIYCTVGSDDKVAYLIDHFAIPREHIFHSRDASFLAGIMRETDGHGVDVVLNSLSGELLHASWKCVSEFGAMVEIGKRDLIGQARLDMEAFHDNRAFFGVEMWHLATRQPKRIRALGRQFNSLWEAGAIGPIRPVHVLDGRDVEGALRTMLKATHIGKLVVRMPDDDTELQAAPLERGLALRGDKAYLLVGGFGGLGRSVATWMVERGARHLIFLSRSGGTNLDDQDLVAELQSCGCAVQVFAGDVAVREDVDRCVGEATLPIAGVVQLSMVLKDCLFQDMPLKDWEAVTRPKIQGTWNLHLALLEVGSESALDFFVLFSSFAGIVGLRGQANYSAGNTFQDAFVQYRLARGLPASVLDVGAVSDIGFVARRPDLIGYFENLAQHFLTEQDVLDTFELAVRNGLPKPKPSRPDAARDLDDAFISEAQLTLAMRSVLPLSAPNNHTVWKRDPRFGHYRNLEVVDRAGAAAAAAASAAAGAGGAGGEHEARLVAFLKSIEASASPGTTLATDATVAQLANFLAVAFSSFMMMPVDEMEKVDLNEPLTSLGIDSLVTIEVCNWVRTWFAVNISVLEAMQSGSLMGMARLLQQRWLAKLSVS